jgi:hypothetical protein
VRTLPGAVRRLRPRDLLSELRSGGTCQQFGELLRIQQERLAALDAIPTEHKRQLAESGVLTANYESTIKDGFTALETYLKSRFIADAPIVSLVGKGACSSG